MTIPVRMNRSTGITAPKTWTMLWGRIVGSGWGVLPKANSTIACAMSRTPSEDTSLASGEALRSGRKAMSSTSTPKMRTMTRLLTSAGAVPIWTPATCPVFSAQ